MANVPARGLPESAEDLVRLAADGHAPAFARIVRLHHADLARACLIVTGDMALARDAVAAAWPIAWSRLGRVGDPDRLAAWLAPIAVAEARRVTRGPWLDPAAPGVAALQPATSEPAETASDPDPALTAALSALTRDDRALLALRFVAGLEPDELARALGRSRRDPQVRLRTLIADLATTLGEPAPVAGSELAIERRIRAHAAVEVRPVDADRAARVARAEIANGRHHLVSVMVSAVLAVIVIGTLDVVSAGTAGNPHPITGVAPSPSARAAPSPGGDGSPGIR